MDAVAWIKWAVAIVSEYWKALAGTGVTSAGLVVLAWVRGVMVGRTARTIYEHIEGKNDTVRRRMGPSLPVIEEALGFSTRRQNARRCMAG
jgi:hypothetical protein